MLADESFRVRISTDELRDAKAAAHADGLTLSAWVRRLMRERVKRLRKLEVMP